MELPEVCTYCGLCAKLCPVDAIECDVELGLAKPASDVGLVFDAPRNVKISELVHEYVLLKQ